MLSSLLRASLFTDPPIQIKYKGDLVGGTSALVLPSPLVAFVPLAQIRSDKPTPPQKQSRRR